jgi:hypothetical protein
MDQLHPNQQPTTAALARMADIVKLRDEGMSYRQIGLLLKLSRQRINAICVQAARRKGIDGEKAGA